MSTEVIERIVSNPAIQKLIGDVTSNIEHYATHRDLKPLDRLLAKKEITPGLYMATTLVCSVSGYLEKSQENEAALITLINDLSTKVVESSIKIMNDAKALNEARIDLLKTIAKQCHEEVVKAKNESEKNVLQVAAEKPDPAIIQMLKDTPDALATYMKGFFDDKMHTKDQLTQINSSGADALKKVSKHLTQMVENTLRGEQEFYQNVITFYGEMLQRAQTTLEESMKRSKGITERLIDGGFELIKLKMQQQSQNDDTSQNRNTGQTAVGSNKSTLFGNSSAKTLPVSSSPQVEELDDHEENSRVRPGKK